MTAYCSPAYQFGYFDSPNFSSLSLQIIGCLSIPIDAFGAYCILFKTPKSMESVKFSMLRYLFSTFLFHVVVNFLVCPFIVMPHSTFLPRGVFQFFGVHQIIQAACGLFCMAATYFTIVQTIENRYMIITNGNRVWRLIRIPWMILNYIVAMVMLVPLYFGVPKNQELAKKLLFEEVPCLPSKIREDPALFVIADNMNMQMMIIIFAALWFWSQLRFFTWRTFRALKKNGTKLSEKTIRLQRKFIKAYIIQVGVPIILIGSPAAFLVYEYFFQTYNQALNSIIVAFFTCYGCLSTSLMILVHTPYRHFLLEKIRDFFEFFGVKMVTERRETISVIPSIARNNLLV